MLRFIKALIVIWPFLKSLVFQDRNVRDVLYANRHFTWLFVLLLVVVLVFHITLNYLVSGHHMIQRQQVEIQRLRQQLSLPPPTASDGEVALTDCAGILYDPSQFIDLVQ